jgi:hypothetical protein
MLIIVALVGITGAMVAVAAVTIQTRSVTTINGEVFTVTGDLTISNFNTSIAIANVPAAGATTESAIPMAAGGATANTAITLGDYTYSATVTVFNVHDSQTYTVTLLQSGVNMGVVHIAQGATTLVGDSVTITWDLGTSLTSAVYEVNIVTP